MDDSVTPPKSEFLKTLISRGYMHQVTNLDGLDKLAEQQPISAYIGFDCTANSLHVGSLIQIMMLRLLQRTGHKPIVLMGGGTTKVGDPSGKDEARPLLSDQDIEQIILNEYYESAVDDYTSGTVRYQLKDLNIGLHSVKVTAWDVYNNKGEGFTKFVVAEDAVMALDHVFNYPNPFSTNTNFQFEHNQPFQDLDVQIQIYTVSGKLIKTIDHFVPGITNEGYRVSDIHWDGKDENGDRLANGVYVYKVQVRSMNNDQESTHNSAFQKLVILK